MKDTSRRGFIKQTIAGAAGIAVLPSLYGFRFGANDTIRIGIIGLGQQAMFLMMGFARIEGIEIVAGADVYGIKSVKAMDNLLKLGLAWRAIGKEEAACEAYERLAEHFAEVPSYIRNTLTREQDAVHCNRESNDMTR